VALFGRVAGGPLWCHVRLRPSDSGRPPGVTGDLVLSDAAGRVVAEVRGFEVRRIQRGALLGREGEELGDWLYERVWQAAPRAGVGWSSGQASGSWLIFTDGQGVGEALIGRLQAAGARCVRISSGVEYRQVSADRYTVNPGSVEEFERVLAAALGPGEPAWSGIVHLGSSEVPAVSEGATAESLLAGQRRVCGSVLHLVQALVARGLASRLWLITCGSQTVDARQDPSQPDHASLWGLARVIPLEHPELPTVCVDLDPQGPAESLDELLLELSQPDGETQIAFRNRQRWVARLLPIPPAHETAMASVGSRLIHRDASYLITGGFGALGLRVASWLVDQGARYLVLAGRRGASSEAARAAVAALQAAGAEVLAVAADVSRAEDVAGLLAAAANRFPPLAGILHLAGVLDDGVLLKQDLERLDRVMAPKVAGAWNLHILASRLPLDFFVVFSSAAGLLGAPGQANYAAANAFLDALMHYRRRQGLPALSIDWGPWGHEGMASVAEAGDQDRWSSRGIGVIRPELGLRLLGSLMGSDITQVAALSADWPRLLGVLSAHGVEPLLSGLAQAALSRTPQENGSERDRQRRRKLIECGPDQRRALATTMIQEEVAGVLRLASPDSADPQQGFFHMGMDSLAALELRNRLQVVLDRRLPATIAMECSNVTELAEYVVDKILETSGIGTVAVPAAVEQEDSLAPPSRLEHPSQEDVDACIADELAELENYLEGT